MPEDINKDLDFKALNEEANRHEKIVAELSELRTEISYAEEALKRLRSKERILSSELKTIQGDANAHAASLKRRMARGEDKKEDSGLSN